MRRRKRTAAKSLELLDEVAETMVRGVHASVCGEGRAADAKNLKDLCAVVKELAGVVRSLDEERAQAQEKQELVVRFLDATEAAAY